MKILDPVCGMIVDVSEQREAGLTMELADREYAFCSAGCLRTFAKTPPKYVRMVDEWLAAGSPSTGAEHHH